jgi:hypothetical protein
MRSMLFKTSLGRAVIGAGRVHHENGVRQAPCEENIAKIARIAGIAKIEKRTVQTILVIKAIPAILQFTVFRDRKIISFLPAPSRARR